MAPNPAAETMISAAPKRRSLRRSAVALAQPLDAAQLAHVVVERARRAQCREQLGLEGPEDELAVHRGDPQRSGTGARGDGALEGAAAEEQPDPVVGGPPARERP